MSDDPVASGIDAPTYIAPPEVVDVIRGGYTAARSGRVGGVLSMFGIEVAEAALASALSAEHVRAMAVHFYEESTTAADLFGGGVGRDWARNVIASEADQAIEAIVAASRAKLTDGERQARRLRELSVALNRIDERFRAKVEGVLSQAMRRADRHARTKAAVRTRRLTKAKAAAIANDLNANKLTPAVMQTISTTDEELLAGMFDDAADEVCDLFDERQQARRKALLVAFGPAGLTEDLLDQHWDAAEKERVGALGAFLGLALFSEARSRLQSGATGPGLFDPRGEVPFDTSVPGAIVQGAMRIADGATVSNDPGAPGGLGVVEPAPGDLASHAAGDPLGGQTDNLVDDVVGGFTPGGATVQYVWQTGDPRVPFEPHWEIPDYGPFTAEDYLDACGKDPGDYPFGSVAYYPGDHAGCQCWLAKEYLSADGSVSTDVGPEDLGIGEDVVDGEGGWGDVGGGIAAAPSDPTADLLAAARARLADLGGWSEEDHPRADNGKFGEGSGGSGSGTFTLEGNVPEQDRAQIEATMRDLSARFPIGNVRVRFASGDDAITQYANAQSGDPAAGNQAIHINADAWATAATNGREAEMAPYLVNSSQTGTLTHEYGHLAAAAAERAGAQPFQWEEIDRDFQGGESTFSTAPSVYALENRYEMSAELFARAVTGAGDGRAIVPDPDAAWERADSYMGRLRETLGWP